MAPLLHEGLAGFALVLGCTFLAFSIDISLLLCFYGGHMGRQHRHFNGRTRLHYTCLSSTRIALEEVDVGELPFHWEAAPKDEPN